LARNSLEGKDKSQLSDKERIRDFQRKIYLKAKQEKSFRFYILYDKIKTKRFLIESFIRVRKKKGTAGIDGITFEWIAEYGVEKYLDEIQKELEMNTYRPSAVLRTYIPKANGKMRPLGIPTIKDRIVQMSCKMVIEPIFEADFENCSYGFRPKRSAKDAIRKIKENLKSKKTEIMDADLKSYFDTIPHDKLMILVGQRISDKYLLKLIKMWLKAPVVENNKYSGGKKSKKGIPQGGVISPLLANIYLNLLDKIVNKENGIFKQYGIEIVRYADDFILMGSNLCKAVTGKVKYVLDRMDLKINDEKTKVINAYKEAFDFLGFTVRYDRGKKYNGMYWNIMPSRKSCKKIRENMKQLFRVSRHWNPYYLVQELNWRTRGWINYFTIPGVSYTTNARYDMRWYLYRKIWNHYRRKSQKKCKLYHKAFDYLIERYRLINPIKYSLV